MAYQGVFLLRAIQNQFQAARHRLTRRNEWRSALWGPAEGCTVSWRRATAGTPGAGLKRVALGAPGSQAKPYEGRALSRLGAASQQGGRARDRARPHPEALDPRGARGRGAAASLRDAGATHRHAVPGEPAGGPAAPRLPRMRAPSRAGPHGAGAPVAGNPLHLLPPLRSGTPISIRARPREAALRPAQWPVTLHVGKGGATEAVVQELKERVRRRRVVKARLLPNLEGFESLGEFCMDLARRSGVRLFEV